MLLQHGWLAPLSKPEAITEDEEDEVNGVSSHENVPYEDGINRGNLGDKEIADWVQNALERKQKGIMKETEKPALHKVDLAAVSPAASPISSPLAG